MVTSRIKIGMKVRDVITGFTGIVTAHTRFMTGCDRFTVSQDGVDPATGKVKEDAWFDEQRLEILNSNPLRLPGATETLPSGPAPG